MFFKSEKDATQTCTATSGFERIDARQDVQNSLARNQHWNDSVCRLASARHQLTALLPRIAPDRILLIPAEIPDDLLQIDREIHRGLVDQ